MKWKELGAKLVEKAGQDEFVVDRLIHDPETPPEILGFHLEQAAEKLLKAALSFSQIGFPQTHQLVVLLDLLRDHRIQPPKEFEQLRILAPYAVQLRYDFIEEGALLKKHPDFPSLLKLVKKLRKWVMALGKD